MNRLHNEYPLGRTDADWMPFPGGELEGKRTRALCPDCRAKGQQQEPERSPSRNAALCFQCYRVELDHNRRIKAAGELDTASAARFQSALPFAPVNTSRLARLKIERHDAQARARVGVGLYVEKRRRAQVEARHALARIFEGLKQRSLVDSGHSRA